MCPALPPRLAASRAKLAAVLALGVSLLSRPPVQAAPAAALAPDTDPTAAINRLVERRWEEAKVTPAPLCDDRAFARRLYLDLSGRIPTPAEADAFASDTAPNKRAALADRLLAGPEYARHMRDIFDVALMGRPAAERRQRRRGEQPPVDFRSEWLAYLERSFTQNRPWDRLLRDILLARPDKPEERGAVWFLYARGDRYQEIAEAVSPAAFGIQVQCAQCHNHPLAHEIEQRHYWGLVAFFNRGKNQVTRDGPCVAESAVGGFNNFATLSGESHPAELAFYGVKTVAEVRPAENAKQEDTPDLYRPKPEGWGAEQPAVPRFSRREQFVENDVKGNPLVARAAVNRFWALLMGRGFVHPVDKMDSQHPASHPELLEWLARGFERSGYDVKRLVRAIVLSRPYQLDSRHSDTTQPELFAYGVEKPLSAEALYRSFLVAATGKADAEKPELRDAFIEVFPELFAEENIATLKQTMFFSNNPMIQQMVQAKGDSTAARLARIADPAARVRQAFRTAFAREPAPDELKEAAAFLMSRPDQQKATAQLWWALLTGPEFRCNH